MRSTEQSRGLPSARPSSRHAAANRARLRAGLLAAAAVTLGHPALGDSPVVDWSGYFAGATLSHNWGKLDTQGNTSHIDTDQDNVWALGIFGGHRWQMDDGLVAGLLIEIPLFAETEGAVDTFWFPGANPPVSYEYDIDYAFLITGQLGRSYGRWLPFIEAGVGMAGVTYKVHNVNLADVYTPGFVQQTSNDHLIWKFGVGADYRIEDNLIAGFKLDYLRSDQRSYEVQWLAPWPAYIGAHSVSANFSLAYQFD